MLSVWGLVVYIVLNDVQQVIAVCCYCNGMLFIKANFIFRVMVREGVIEYRIKTRSLVTISFKFSQGETHA